MVTIKSAEQIQKMRVAGALLHSTLQMLREHVRPGVTTEQLDGLAEQFIRDGGGIPSFKGYEGFPYTICASVDEQVVHGFATDAPLQAGALLSIDCGCIVDGWHSDSAFSMVVGGSEANPKAQRLIDITQRCFYLGANMARAGRRLGDIGHAIETYARSERCGVIRDMTGHGIGRALHEDPEVRNYGFAGRGMTLKAGMTIAIEPMISLGTWRLRFEENGWTAVTADRSLAAHYEHTVLVTNGAPELLSCPGATISEALQ